MTFLASENEGHLRCPAARLAETSMWRYLFLRRSPDPVPHRIPRWYDTDLIPWHDDTTVVSDDAGIMPSASPAQKTPTGPLSSAAADRSHSGGASFGALAYAAGTLVQIGTRSTPYVRSLDLPTGSDLGGRSR